MLNPSSNVNLSTANMVKQSVLFFKLRESFNVAVNQVNFNVDVVQVLNLFIAVILEIPFLYGTTDHA